MALTISYCFKQNAISDYVSIVTLHFLTKLVDTHNIKADYVNVVIIIYFNILVRDYHIFQLRLPR